MTNVPMMNIRLLTCFNSMVLVKYAFKITYFNQAAIPYGRYFDKI